MISIIVITYNSALTILETLNSIYDQTYQDIELIISDDGSSDTTIQLVTEWINNRSHRFVNTKIIQGKNSGVTKNCNRGIAAATGDFIQIIAGDDILVPDAVKIKLEYALKNNEDVVFCKIEPFGDDEEAVKRMIAFCENGYDIINKGYKSQRDSILIDNFIGGPSGSFYRRTFMQQLNGYDERYSMLEDYPFIYHYIYSGKEIHLIDNVLTRYRISGSSLCQKKGTPTNLCQADFFFNERLKEMIKEKKYKIAARQWLRFFRIKFFT